MTVRIRVETSAPYDVLVGSGVSDQLASLVGDDVRRVAIVHPTVLRERAARLRSTLLREQATRALDVHLLEVPDGEAAKNAEVLQYCWDVLGRTGFTRSDVVVGFGGGATTDLAGFVAASWLRGVRFVNVSTTVLGMVDAAVGGKTGINTAAGKNLVGAFHEPVGVLCDLDLLVDLPSAELRSGLAEVVKCGFIADPSILELIEGVGTGAVLDPTSAILAELVAKGIRVKAQTVAGDLRETGGGAGPWAAKGAGRGAGPWAAKSTGGGAEDDSGIGREALNYGHTLGHAIEREERYTVRHGEAISVGMVYVAELAHRHGLIDADLVQRHRDVLSSLSLPTTWAGAFSPLLAAMRLDKKTRGDQLRFVVLEDLGRTTILAGPDEQTLRDSFAALAAPSSSPGAAR
ncbi:3-dehydroquinate synthase family protein [Aeromicrobium sp. REDSEA-S38_B2]|jgi:3-dehydroquinate synthase|uniref:3-dehydroquinate synthase family protein n=1 Tax=Aeromicrobium sp. REDSEA-S38_B2 TaxID=1811528 RepID=UPI000B243A27|nr:3-dehydroquinate synthase family protein [Aeromicrobium sp. REDSEA-S38_B2]